MLFSDFISLRWLSVAVCVLFLSCAGAVEEQIISDASESVHSEFSTEYPPEPEIPEEIQTPEPPPESLPPEPKPPEPVVVDQRPIPEYPRDGHKGIITHVTDGDTLYLVMRVGGWASRVRLTGINAPECTKTSSSGTPFQHCSSSTEYFGLEAYQELKELVSGTNNKVNISCIEENQQCEKDMFDRYLAYLYLPDKRDIGEVLLQKGMVLAFTRYDHARTAAYCRAEAQAIRNRVGMWKNGRDYVKERMSSATKAWYYHKTSSQTHDAICSKALGQSFAKMAGE